MKKNLGISSVVAVLAVACFYAYYPHEHVVVEAQNNTPVDAVHSKNEINEAVRGVVQPHKTDATPEPQKVFSAEEVSVLKVRSQEISSQLDGLTKQLDLQLENPEQRKNIEAQFQVLAEEQNQLAIQLVKFNQQAALAE